MSAIKLSQFTNDVLKSLDGSEIWSFHYGDCVGIKGDKVISKGVVIDVLDTEKKINALFRELCAQEGCE